MRTAITVAEAAGRTVEGAYRDGQVLFISLSGNAFVAVEAIADAHEDGTGGPMLSDVKTPMGHLWAMTLAGVVTEAEADAYIAQWAAADEARDRATYEALHKRFGGGGGA